MKLQIFAPDRSGTVAQLHSFNKKKSKAADAQKTARETRNNILPSPHPLCSETTKKLRKSVVKRQLWLTSEWSFRGEINISLGKTDLWRIEGGRRETETVTSAKMTNSSEVEEQNDERSSLRLDELPSEILLLIFDYCHAFDLVRLSAVCTRFYDVAQDEMLWYKRSKKTLATNQVSKRFRLR